MPNPFRVLVVDDYPDSAEASAQVLALHGYDARPALSCAAALRAVGTGFAPDVVLLDLRLPDGNGYALAAELCRVLPVQPVLVAVTGLHGQEAQARAAGFAHCLLKPVNPNELVALLGAYSGGPGAK